MPGRTQPWPMSEDCWSPATPQIGGAPASAVASPITPVESTIRGIIDSGIRRRSSTRSSSRAGVGREQPPDRGVGQVGHVVRALGELPDDPRVGRAEAQVPRAVGVDRVEDVGELRRGQVRGEVEALGVEAEAVADGAQVLPALGRCDRHAGRPVPDDRGRPLVADADRRRPARARRASRGRSSSASRAYSAASNSTSPGTGRVGQRGAADSWRDRRRRGARPRTRTPLVPDVDDENAHVIPLALRLRSSPPVLGPASAGRTSRRACRTVAMSSARNGKAQPADRVLAGDQAQDHADALHEHVGESGRARGVREPAVGAEADHGPAAGGAAEQDEDHEQEGDGEPAGRSSPLSTRNWFRMPAGRATTSDGDRAAPQPLDGVELRQGVAGGAGARASVLMRRCLGQRVQARCCRTRTSGRACRGSGCPCGSSAVLTTRARRGRRRAPRRRSGTG